MSKTYYVPALDKAFDVIEYLARSMEPLPLSVIAKDLNRSSSELFRIMDFLVQRKYVIKDHQLNSYRLSFRFFDLTLNLPLVRRLVEASSPLLHQLAADVRFSSHVSVMEGGDIVVLNEEESVYPVYIHTKVGARIPATSTSSGRLLLGLMDETNRQNALALDAHYQAMPEERRLEILEELNRHGDAGYSISQSKQNEAVIDIVLPIRLYADYYAALAVPVSKASGDERTLETLVDRIRRTVAAIESRLNG